MSEVRLRMAEKVNKGGRPKKELKYDYALISDLAGIFCTQDEIANIMGVSVRTLQRDDEFCRLYKNGIDNVKSTLRRLQLKSAMAGSIPMQIWLGKQYLGQREPQMENIIPNDELNDDMNDYEK